MNKKHKIHVYNAVFVRLSLLNRLKNTTSNCFCSLLCIKNEKSLHEYKAMLYNNPDEINTQSACTYLRYAGSCSAFGSKLTRLENSRARYKQIAADSNITEPSSKSRAGIVP